jgi:UDP-2,4-diacetamido-2,4,6-trideoxy-beta-L-altropyranose hydrolase
VFLGGMDANNVTEQALLAVASTRMQGLAVDVVIGASHPARERVRALCDSLPDARCHVQTAEIVDLLAAADIAIGAGGTATWERCALGVPTLALCIADNQRELLTHASRAGLLCTPDPSDTSDPDVIAVHLRSLLDNSGLRHHLSSRGMELVDGDGARRVASVLQSAEIVVRLATAADGDRLYAWRNHPDVRKASRDASEIDLHTHRQWLDGVLASDSRHLLIGERASEPIGVVRFDVESDTAEVSIYLVAQAMGRGHGQALLRAAEHWLRRERPDVRSLRAHVHAGNRRSQRLFEQCGYIQQSADYEKGISR